MEIIFILFQLVWNKLNNLNTRWFPGGAKPFFYLEVIDLAQNGEIRNSWYTHLGKVTEFRYCVKVKDVSIDITLLYVLLKRYITIG